MITYGGAAPNVVPNFAEVYYYIRHPSSDIVSELYPRLERCAEGAALATGTRLEINHQGGIKEILPNNVLSQVSLANLRQLNDLEYSKADIRFATRLGETLPRPKPLDSITEVLDLGGGTGMGSTDVGDVSWVVPTAGFSTACWVPGTPGHSWQAVACGAQPIARKGMNLAARVIAANAWDLYTQPDRVAAAREEHQQKLTGRAYQSLMLPGQKPPLDYRKPPKR